MKKLERAQTMSSIDEGFHFGDSRLNKRCKLMLNHLSQNSGKTLRQALSNPNDYEAARRFFDNNLLSPEKILEPHFQATKERCSGEKLVAVLQDSSDLDFDYLKVEGFGPMSSNVDQGYRIHPSLVITEAGVPLGLLGYSAYTRDADDKGGGKHRNCQTIQEKESFRWLEGYRSASRLARELGQDTCVVSISDREGDIYEVLQEAEQAKLGSSAHVVIRAQHNRCLDQCVESYSKLERKLHRVEPMSQARFTTNVGQANEREVLVNIRACPVMIKAPNTATKKSLPSVAANALLISEVDPPALQSEQPKGRKGRNGNPGLYWVLITTLPIDSVEQVKRVVSLYTSRWQIEIYFKVLKSGCGINKTRLRTRERIENFIAFSLLVAWRVMLATYLPREFPDVPCTVLFTDIEWTLAHLTVYKNADSLPESPPSLADVSRLIAQLGGYKKQKTPPGIVTMWRGITRLFDIVYGYELASEHRERLHHLRKKAVK